MERGQRERDKEGGGGRWRGNEGRDRGREADRE